MSFGLSNILASFQSYINKILAKKLNIFIIVYLDDILIYTKDPGQGHVKAVRWVLDILRRHRLFANLKKYQFHKNKVCFLSYIVLAQRVRIEDKQIEAVKNWPEPTLVTDIQVFIGFANFYQRFIQDFSRIAAPLTSMLKTTRLSKESAPKTFRADDNEVIDDDGSRANETARNSSRKSTRVPNIGATGESNFLTPTLRRPLTIYD